MPVESVAQETGQSDPYSLGPILANNNPESVAAYGAQSPISSVSEPAPGEPLNVESERLLSDIPQTIGDQGGAAETLNEEESAAALGALAGMDPAFLQGLISFDESDVRAALEEGFDFLAERFDSGHWKLTERQSRMLGRPTAQLLSTLWTKLSFLLPDQLAKWCASTPGLAGFVLTSAIVIGPKVAQQWSVSRQRRSLPEQPKRNTPGPVPVAPRPQAGPVGAINANPPEMIPTDHNFE